MDEFEIEFDEVSPAEGNIFAQDLRGDLMELMPSADISLKKSRPDSQDFGATLVLVLGTPVAIIAAKAISAWLKRNSGVTLTIKSSGEIIGTNLDSNDAARIVEALSKSQK